VAIDAVLLESGYAAGQVLPDCVEVCDALARPDPLPGRDIHWDLVIGNPPYGRTSLAPEQRARFRRGLYGHANLYGVFTDLALRHTRPGGIVALVTPTSFLAGNYFKSLRGLLAAEAPPVSLDFVDARKGFFDDVLQETLLAIYRKDGAPRTAQAATLSRQGDGCLLARLAGHFALPANPSDPWLVPRTSAQTTLLSTAANLPARLRDWGYTVSTGPLVWNRHKPQLSAKPCPGCLPLIWAEAVTGDGHFLFRAAKRNHLPWFRIRDRRDEWLIVQTPCVLVQRDHREGAGTPSDRRRAARSIPCRPRRRRGREPPEHGPISPG
jgi:adenine-specific DNA-methyltransferase